MLPLIYHSQAARSSKNLAAQEKKSAVVQPRAAHCLHDLIQMAAEVAAICDALNMAAFEGVAGIMVVRRDVNARSFADDARPGKANPAGADGELIRRAAEK